MPPMISIHITYQNLDLTYRKTKPRHIVCALVDSRKYQSECGSPDIMRNLGLKSDQQRGGVEPNLFPTSLRESFR